METSYIWIILGIVLLVAEMMTTSIFLIFISLGCFAAALTDLVQPNNTALELGVAGVVSVLGAVFLRKPLQKKLLKDLNLKADVGREIQIENGIQAHQTTRVSYQGTTWQATNLDDSELKTGDRAVIVGIDGNTLLIRKST